MVSSTVATLALFGASASAMATGGATVVNQCPHDVYLCDTPSMSGDNGGFTEIDKVLSPGESWSQPWTELKNGNGWSIKLSQTNVLSNILQYEYTFHNDGIIWYDLSCVDGNPWDKDWEITATGAECEPKQQAYRYSTDDAYGMQSCPQAAAITVTLCTGLSADNGTALGSGFSNPGSGSSGSAAGSPDSGSESSAPAPSPAAATTTVAPISAAELSSAVSSASQSSEDYPDLPAASTAAAGGWVQPGINWNNADASASEAAMHGGATPATTSPTTFVTSASAVVTEAPGNVVTVWDTVVATDVVTKYAGSRVRRHEHHAHAHNRHA